MSPDVTDALPGSLRVLRGCSAKIGSGELCPATQIGKLQLWGRCAVTGKLVPFPIVDLWIVPKLQFKIASVGIFEDVGVGFRTDDTVFRYRSYLHIRRSGIKIKVQKRKNIYILDAANPRNKAAPNSYLNLAAMQTSKNIRVIHPRRHYDIDLWFVFGGDKRPTTTPVLVSMATRGVSSSRKFNVCGATFVDAGVKLGDVIAQRAPSCQGSLPALEFIARPFSSTLTSQMPLGMAVSNMGVKCNGNLFLDPKTVTNNENFKFSKFPQETILTIENTQISAETSVSDRYLQDLCTHVHGVPACAALSPNIDINRTFEAVTQNLALQSKQISAPRGN